VLGPGSLAVVSEYPGFLESLLSQDTVAIGEVFTFETSFWRQVLWHLDSHFFLSFGLPGSFFEFVFLSYSTLSKVLSSFKSCRLVDLRLVHHRHCHRLREHLRHVAERLRQVFHPVLTKESFESRTDVVLESSPDVLLNLSSIFLRDGARALTSVADSTDLVNFLAVT